jgi:hypothetical protein
LVEEPVQDLSVVVMNLAVLHFVQHVVRDPLKHDWRSRRAVEQIGRLATIIHYERGWSGCRVHASLQHLGA